MWIQLKKVIKLDLVRGLPLKKMELDDTCGACVKDKQIKSSFKPKDKVSTTQPLELIHIDLFGPINMLSLGRKRYVFVIVDDYSRFTWVIFLGHKDETFERFVEYCNRVENEQGLKINTIRSDHGGEFENRLFDELCASRGYRHEYSAPRTPQQNGVVERKNRTLQELARTMLNETKLPKCLWAEAVNTACYVINRVGVRSLLMKTPFELYMDRKPNISYFRAFGSKCFVLDQSLRVNKFDSKSIEGIFVGYSMTSKAYRVFVPTSMTIMESIHVKFNENINALVEEGSVNDVGNEESSEANEARRERQNVVIVEDNHQEDETQEGDQEQNLENPLNEGTSYGNEEPSSSEFQPPQNLREILPL